MNSLEKHVLRLIGEDVSSPDVFADTNAGIAPVRDSINDAIQELTSVTNIYQKVYHLPLYADRQFYRMGWEADHFGWVVEAWDRNRQRRLTQTDLIRLTADNAWWMKQTGEPSQYMQIGEDVLGIYLKPATNGIVLELTCVCIPKVYTTSNDPIKLQGEYQRAAIYLAVSEYFAGRGDAKRATEYLNRYIETGGLATFNPDTADRSYSFNDQGNRFDSIRR
ncbi:hypothetical protein CMI37_15465 [Candidatus Pacearchaeota archaeon]|nr:hypothetical protein [Candidatus Pacearchaeota archaeon]|tara:strand:+ start:4566 stop:5228 length:663 start_codon:yes stop_codon:yes gene_type:complete